jgi:hypothetical protein
MAAHAVVTIVTGANSTPGANGPATGHGGSPGGSGRPATATAGPNIDASNTTQATGREGDSGDNGNTSGSAGGAGVARLKGGFDLMGFVLPVAFLGAPEAASGWPIEVGRRFRPRRSYARSAWLTDNIANVT